MIKKKGEQGETLVYRTQCKVENVLYLIIFNNIFYSIVNFYINNLFKMRGSINLDTDSLKSQGFLIMTLRKSL